jgi:hypothetical protein
VFFQYVKPPFDPALSLPSAVSRTSHCNEYLRGRGPTLDRWSDRLVRNHRSRLRVVYGGDPLAPGRLTLGALGASVGLFTLYPFYRFVLAVETIADTH